MAARDKKYGKDSLFLLGLNGFVERVAGGEVFWQEESPGAPCPLMEPSLVYFYTVRGAAHKFARR